MNALTPRSLWLGLLGAVGVSLLAPGVAHAGQQPIQLRINKVWCITPSGPFPGDTMKYVGAAIHGDPQGRVPGPINGMAAPMEYGTPIVSMLGPKGQAAAVGLTIGFEGIKQGYEFAKFFDQNRTPDDLYIKVDGRKIWPQGRDSLKIGSGQQRNVGVVVPRAANGQHRIELWEHDDGFLQGDDDLLGDVGFGTGNGTIETVMTFTLSNKSEGSVYMVEVEFFRPPPPPVHVTSQGPLESRNAREEMCGFSDNLRGAAPVRGARSNDLVRSLPPVTLSLKDGRWDDAGHAGLQSHEAAAWGKKMDAWRPSATQRVQRAGVAWTWDVEQEGITFGRQQVIVPYSQQRHTDNNGNAHTIRWISGAPQSASSEYLSLPFEGEFKGDPNPISMERLKPWLDCMSPETRRRAEPALQRMRSKGYLVDTEADVQAVTRGLTIQERIRLGRSPDNIRAAITEGGFHPTSSDLNAAIGAGADDQAVVSMLVELGARPDGTTVSKAIGRGDEALLQQLVRGGARITASHVRDAIAHPDPRQVDMVLRIAGANVPGFRTEDVRTLITAGRHDLARRVVAAGAPCDIHTLQAALRSHDRGLIAAVAPETPASPEALELAIESGDTAMVAQFVRRGASLTDNEPVYGALRKGRPDMARLAMKHGGDPDALLQYSLERRSGVGLRIALETGADANVAVAYAIRTADAPLFTELVQQHGADPQRALNEAMTADDRRFAELAITAGKADPSVALARQVRADQRDWIPFLLDAGADAGAGVDAAIEVKSAQVLAYLVEQGADASSADDVRKAVASRDLPTLQVVIEVAGGAPDDGLPAAIQQDSVNLARYLLDRGARPVDSDVPAASGAMPMVRLLVGAGAEPTTGLEQALSNRHDEVAVYLLDQGARTDGMLPVAARTGLVVSTRKLLEKGADPGEGIPMAVEHGHADVTQVLTRAGADVSGPEHIGLAVARGHADVARVLAVAGADATHVDAGGDTFLHHAARQDGAVDLIGVFLDAGVAVDARNGAGDTALLVAVRVGHANVRVVERLVEAGADINARDAEDRIVWKEAKGRKVKKVLKDAGAERK